MQVDCEDFSFTSLMQVVSITCSKYLQKSCCIKHVDNLRQTVIIKPEQIMLTHPDLDLMTARYKPAGANVLLLVRVADAI